MQFFTEIIQPQMKDKAISAPLFMGGNSLGGLVASYVVLAKPDAFAGLVMQSPGRDRGHACKAKPGPVIA